MPTFELRARETLEAVYSVDAPTEEAAVARLNSRSLRPVNAGVVKSDLIVQDISDKKVSLPSCA